VAVGGVGHGAQVSNGGAEQVFGSASGTTVSSPRSRRKRSWSKQDFLGAIPMKMT
jgi:hypothetical protein